MAVVGSRRPSLYRQVIGRGTRAHTFINSPKLSLHFLAVRYGDLFTNRGLLLALSTSKQILSICSFFCGEGLIVTFSADTRRRTGFDRPCMEDVSPQGSPARTQQQRESLPALDQNLKGTPGNGRQEGLSKPSRWGFLSTEANKGSSKLETFTQKEGESSFLKDRLWSPDSAAIPLRSHYDGNVNGNEKPGLNSGSDQPVDEFGRLLRQEDTDSDLDEDRYGGRKKRRKTMSRSRSRSPGEMRFKYRSPEKTSHGWCTRRSQSWRLGSLQHRHDDVE